MIIRLAVQLMLLPLIVVAVPLMFSVAWIQELVEDLSLRRPPPVWLPRATGKRL